MRGDLGVVFASSEASSRSGCFQGFCIDVEPGSAGVRPLLKKWVVFTLAYLRLVTVGMVFAFLVAGLAEAFLFPNSSGTGFLSGSVFTRTIKGLATGPVMNLCSACIVPVSAAYRSRGGGIEGAIAMVQGSATLNIPALAMAFFVFTPLLGMSRLLLAIVGGLLIGPLVVLAVRRHKGPDDESPPPLQPSLLDTSGWGPVLAEGLREWAKLSIGYLVRMGPIMVVAGFASGLVIQWLNEDMVTRFLGNHLLGVATAATFGILINVPLLFEIPLVALLVLLGMGIAPAATLLFTAAAGGPITFWGLAKVMPKRAVATFATATWAVGALGGVAVLGFAIYVWDGGASLAVEAAGPDAVATVDLEDSRNTGTDSFRRPVFEDVTAHSGVSFVHVPPGKKLAFDFGAGVVVFDLNSDGLDDIYIANSEGPNALYRNEGDGTFTDVASLAKLDGQGTVGNGGCAADFDNDGFQDLYATNYGFSKLYRNNGDGTFADVTSQRMDGHDSPFRSLGCAWGDYDRDGYVDLVVVRHIYEDDPEILEWPDFSTPLGGVALFHNNGDGTFSEVTALLGDISIPGEYSSGNFVAGELGNVWGTGFQAGWADLDNDGDPDLYVVNDIGKTIQRNVLWRNDGPGDDGSWSFRDHSAPSRADRDMDGMGLAIGDYDLDGFLDMYVTNIGPNILLRNSGSGLGFSDRTTHAGVAVGRVLPNDLGRARASRVSWATAFFDYDNDADEDLFVISGFLDHIMLTNPESQRNLLLENSGDGTFLDASGWSGIDDPGYGRGGAYLDFDNDGCLDLFFANFQGPPGLMRNSCGHGNNWLTIETTGTSSNRDGVGARILLRAGGRTQIREIAAGSSQMSQNMMAAHFGLGDSATIDEVEIRWPSGVRQSLRDVAANQRLVVVEPAP